MDVAQSALDSLRTVEFRETLKGYHRDDVDDYLEKAAVEAERLQDQLRQATERLRLAAERIAELEAALKDQPPVAPAQAPSTAAVTDDSLQRTLVLAQKFVDETKADAEAQAAKVLADANHHARSLTEGAEARAAQIAEESEGRLREDIARLENVRGRLSADVEAMAQHLESERNRLRGALADVIKWVDDMVQPVTSAAQVDKGGQAPAEGPREPVRSSAPSTAPASSSQSREGMPPPARPAAPIGAAGNTGGGPGGGLLPPAT
jgi:cell division initiation protein